MPIPYYEHSRRRPHTWKLRADGFRELFLSKGWSMRGGYSQKSIAGRQVMVLIIKKTPDYYVCQFGLKDDFWANITRDARQREAEERRSRFTVVGE